MRPPSCVICLRTPQDGEESSFEIVRFVIDADEEAFEREQALDGWVGHPPWLMWFCDEHLALGKELADLHWREAGERLRTTRR